MFFVSFVTLQWNILFKVRIEKKGDQSCEYLGPQRENQLTHFIISTIAGSSRPGRYSSLLFLRRGEDEPSAGTLVH